MTELTTEAALAGLLRLAVAEREERIASDPEAKKTEVLLDQAGLTHLQIYEATGKKPDAVRMAISRASSANVKSKKTTAAKPKSRAGATTRGRQKKS
jgi:hypothetical protein